MTELLYCKNCKEYTMKEKHNCGEKTVDPTPKKIEINEENQ